VAKLTTRREKIREAASALEMAQRLERATTARGVAQVIEQLLKERGLKVRVRRYVHFRMGRTDDQTSFKRTVLSA
jgi:hypothetical protein